MKRIRYGLIVLWMLLCLATSAAAQVSIGIGLPNVSIGINLPLFPQLVRVPGYPIYYAPQLDANYFFYDGMYWVYQNDNWYASTWYNGPWSFVQPEVVPLFVLRIPVRYYRQPPVYFRGWQSNAPPRWGQHWGHGWEERRSGWDRWKRSSAPAPAPLPVYQRQYTGDRYPRVEQQHMLRNQSYRYQPRDKVVRQHFQQQVEQKTPAPAQRVPTPAHQRAPAPAPVQESPVPAPRGRQETPPVRTQRRPDIQRTMPLQQGAPAPARPQPQYRGGENMHKTTPVQTPPQQRAAPQQKKQPAPPQHEQKAPRVKEQDQRSQERGESQAPNRGQGQGKDEERGRGRNN